MVMMLPARVPASLRLFPIHTRSCGSELGDQGLAMPLTSVAVVIASVRVASFDGPTIYTSIRCQGVILYRHTVVCVMT